jgi:UDP-N-acetylmuramoyl-tripeptide--D-alanyl-D-alanine ligase
MKARLRRVSEVLGITAKGDAEITGWSTDSRTLEPGDLFFALRGPNHDGHEHVVQAFKRGAVGAVVDRPVDAAAGSFLPVHDTLKALQYVSAWARRSWTGDVIGVTGSAGKTTTKDTIAAMLAVEIPTAKTIGNLNNHIGVPLTLLRIPEDARVAVVEMGMNSAGEIRALANLAAPKIGVVTTVGYAHMQGFHSIEGVAAAKRELIEELPPGGTAVLNADDPRVAAFATAHPGPVVTFGLSEASDVRAHEVEATPEGVKFAVGSTRFKSSLVGRHSVRNILAGIAVAGLYGISPDRLVNAVAALEPGPMRGQHFTHNGILIINDCYNSNPDAVRSMLDLLRDIPARRRIAVLGEMLELGHWAETLHRGVGDYAAALGIEVLVGIRGAARYTRDAALGGDRRVDAAYFFETPDEAGQFLRSFAQPGDAVLFKGSRGTHVERALERFLG